MLYDQALLTLAYVEAYQATGAPKFKVTAKEILDYVLGVWSMGREGGLCSAQDADSEGEEGKFYVWTLDEVLDALSPADAELAVHLYGLKAEGNYADQGSHANGKNILHIAEPLEDLAAYKGLTIDELIMQMGKIQNALFEIRQKRVAPTIDDKVLADWNGLAIAALARAGVVFDNAAYLDAASRTADFILNHMRKGDALYHRYAKGEVAVEGFLDDYAFNVYGLIQLYEATLDDKYLQAAAELGKSMVSKFWDQQNGGFYQTQTPQADMPKIKQLYDGATPSGNSVAFLDLLWLSRLTNEPTYDQMATQMTKTFAEEVEGAPDAYTFFLLALDFQLGPSYSVTVVGDPKAKDTQEMLKTLSKQYLPTSIIQLKRPDAAGLGYQQIKGKATAYVCRDQTCLPATEKQSVMLEQLGIKEAKP
jgi:hypothetical protein